MELPPIIHDLAVIVVVSAIVAFVFHKLQWPVVLGYLLSGVLLGPNLFYKSPIINDHSMIQLSELGVVFLMFYIGLEFDLKKLRSLVGSSILAVILQTIGMILIGILAAPLLGWSKQNGLFLGGVLAISSTMVSISVLGQQGGLKHSYGQLALGVMILEDIVAIILLVIFGSMGVSGQIEFMQVWQVIFLVGVFVGMVYFVGKLLAPRLLKMLGEFESAEMVTLFAVAFMLGLGLLADKFNFSLALGAFLAGAILSQSSLSHEIEHAIVPFKNLFSAVFFVTVGMMVNPWVIMQYWKQIIFVSILTVFGKVVTVYLGYFLAGQNPKNAFRASLCKAQIGEFSFIIAALGQSIGVVGEEFTAIVVGVSLLTILLTPVLNYNSEKLFEVAENRMPSVLIRLGRVYSTFFQAVKEHLSNSTILKLIRRPILQIIFYFILFDGVVLSASWGTGATLELPVVKGYETYVALGIWVITAVVSLPFFIAVIRNFDAMILIISEATFSPNKSKSGMVERLKNLFHAFLLCAITAIFSAIYLSAVSLYFPGKFALLIFILIVLAVVLFAWNGLVRLNSRIETLFLDSLEQQMSQDEGARVRELVLQQINEKYPWPIQLTEFVIPTGTLACGLRVNELHLRSKTGASIIGINRHGFTEYDPDPFTRLFPEDHLFILGEDEQLEKATQFLGQKISANTAEQHAVPSFGLHQIFIGKDSILVGETLASSNLRRRYGVNVVGIQRGEQKITAPAPEEMIKLGDILIVAGSQKAIDAFAKVHEEGGKAS